MSQNQRRRRCTGRIILGLLAAVIILSISAIVAPRRGAAAAASSEERERALADCNRVATALRHYMSDTGYRPSGFQGNESYGWLKGSGADPSFARKPAGWVGDLRWFLSQNYMADRKWAGPYAGDVPPDPWGRQYVVLTEAYWPANDGGLRAWILSSGPNGVVETAARDLRPAGDDIGIVLD